MACTTELVNGDQLGGVTLNLTVAACPGASRPKAVFPTGCAVQPCGSWRATWAGPDHDARLALFRPPQVSV